MQASQTLRHAALLLVAMTFIGPLDGCIAFPVPRPEHYETWPPGGTERPWDTLKIGETSRQNVFERFDAPHRRWHADRVWVYRWITSNTGLVVLVTDLYMSGAAVEFPITKDHFLLIEFDRQGVVSRFEVKDGGQPVDWWKNSWPSADALAQK